jgi:hypothetical protein
MQILLLLLYWRVICEKYRLRGEAHFPSRLWQSVKQWHASSIVDWNQGTIQWVFFTIQINPVKFKITADTVQSLGFPVFSPSEVYMSLGIPYSVVFA